MPVEKSKHYHTILEGKTLIPFYLEIRKAYIDGNAKDKARENYYKACKNMTQYDYGSYYNKIYRLLLEYTVGYGIKPFRSLFIGFMVIMIFMVIFFLGGFSASLYKAFLLSSSAFFSIGDLEGLCFPTNILYVIETFLGYSILGLYVTALASKWFL